jgi:hypothetical protein
MNKKKKKKVKSFSIRPSLVLSLALSNLPSLKQQLQKKDSISIPLTSLLLMDLPELPNYSKDELTNKKTD